MTRKEQLGIIDEMDSKLKEILISKGNDYATGDVLSNFKRLSEAAKILNINIHTPEGYALFMVLLKIDRVNNLVTSGKTPSNEPIDDSFFDGVNYLKLAYCCWKEQQ